jgi:hypothetical protein
MATVRPPIDQEAIDKKAKETFVKAFEGAHVKIKTTFKHRVVIRAYKRTFNVVTRNWHLATTLAASRVADAAVKIKVQEQMLAKVTESLNKMTRHLQVLEAQIADAVSSDPSLATMSLDHGRVHVDDVVMMGPVSAKFRQLLLACDNVLDKATILYTAGEMAGDAFSTAQLEVRNILRGVDTSMRNHRIAVMRRINAEGGARPGFAGKAATAEGGTEGAGEDTPAAEAAPAAAAPEAPAAAAG